MIDAASGGALGDMTPTKARHLIEKMASNSQQFSTKNDNAIVIRGVHDVAIDADKNLESKLDALVNLVTQLVANQKSASVARVCSLCSLIDHHTNVCPSLQQSGVNEHPEAYVANIYNRPPVQYDLSSNRYNLGWRNHPNLRWSNYQQQQQPSPPFQNNAGPSRYVPSPIQKNDFVSNVLGVVPLDIISLESECTNHVSGSTHESDLQVKVHAVESLVPSTVQPAPIPELKPLPENLKYADLEDDEKLPVIISTSLDVVQEEKLMHVLKKHKKAISWTLADIPGINERDELIPTRVQNSWRACIDYRRLNQATRKDHFSLPFIDQMLEPLASKSHYCFLDGFSGYFQIHIAPEDQEKTTFTCPFGTFSYRRMPFGLCNAPGTFQLCMLSIFSDFLENYIEVFMDDFTVYGSSFDTCLDNLDRVLNRCIETDLVLNFEKCHFMVEQGIVLGHIISSKGIEVDPAKVFVISQLPYPSCVREVRSFLGHGGFYRRFVKEFSKKTLSLSNLL
uniref:Retrovirus-related Pol polyprotein from transposon 17.6 n=1 Tax=Cajanus cajan TaxID=3821 RepID=A0A151UGJ7_CAJCA